MEKEIKFYYPAIYAEVNKDLDKNIKDYKEKCKELGRTDIKFVYLFEEEELQFDSKPFLNKSLEDRIEYAYRKLKWKINKDNIIISFRHSSNAYVDSNVTCKRLYELTQKYPYIKLGIEDADITWDVYDIIKANQKLDDIADKIKKLDLSPAEQLLMAYFEVTGIPYQEESEDENKNISRAIYSILNSNKIVCVGYVELLKEIMARVNKDNVVMFENCLMLNENGTDYSHMTAIVYLKDEKYNLNGYYYIDPTSDTKRKDEPNKFALASFLVPLGMLRYSFNELKSDEMTEKRGIAQFMNALDSNTKLSYNYIKDMPSSVVDEDARPNKRLLDHMLNNCIELREKYNINDETKMQKEIDKKVNKDLIGDHELCFDFLKSQSEPIKIGQLVSMILAVLKKNNFTREEAYSRVKYILKNNMRKEGAFFIKNKLSRFSYDNLKSFCEKYPEFNIFKEQITVQKNSTKEGKEQTC